MKGLVRVKSESELKAGMYVEAGHCRDNHRHPYMLTRFQADDIPCEICGARWTWFAIDLAPHESEFDTNCFACDLEDNDLWRLPDDEQPAETTRSRVRERETS